MEKKYRVILWMVLVLVLFSLFAAIGLPAQLYCRLSVVCEKGMAYFIGQGMYIVVWPVEQFLTVLGSDFLRIPLYFIWFVILGIFMGLLIERFIERFRKTH